MVLVKKKNYLQRFRQSWLSDPNLRDWLRSVEAVCEDGTKELRPKCIYCNKTLCIRYKDLRKHATTSKHLNNCKLPVPTEDGEESFDETSVSYKKDGTATSIEIDQSVTESSPVAFSTKQNLFISCDGTVEDEEEEEVAHEVELTIPASQEMEQLRLEKMRVELEQEKVKLYVLQLSALRAETELGLERSKFTRNL